RSLFHTALLLRQPAARHQRFIIDRVTSRSAILGTQGIRRKPIRIHQVITVVAIALSVVGRTPAGRRTGAPRTQTAPLTLHRVGSLRLGPRPTAFTITRRDIPARAIGIIVAPGSFGITLTVCI